MNYLVNLLKVAAATGIRRIWVTKTPYKSRLPGEGRAPRIKLIKLELARILKSQGEATVPLSVLKEAWARDQSPFFLLKPRLDALADELRCGYVLDKDTGSTTFLRWKPELNKGEKPAGE